MEMCGRVAVAAGEPVFSVVRMRLGRRLGLVTLIASNLLNLITCAAELGGLGILLHLLTGWPERVVLIGSGLVIAAIIYLSKFQWIERSFGLSGLLMIVFGVSAIVLHPDWEQVLSGLDPVFEISSKRQLLLYAYFAVGIFSAMLMEYEVHFYSSGAIEEEWGTKDLGENFMVAALGSILVTADEFRIDYLRLVRILMIVIILDDGEHILEGRFRNDSSRYPVVD